MKSNFFLLGPGVIKIGMYRDHASEAFTRQEARRACVSWLTGR
jgi:hypothetical protein